MNLPISSALTLIFLSLAPLLSAQEKPTKPNEKKTTPAVKKKDIFVKKSGTKDDLKNITYNIGVLLEYISLSHKEANALLGKFAPKANDADELRDTLELMIDKGSASLVETVWIPARTGQRAKVESVKEIVYATEFDPPEIPNNIGNIVVPDSERGKKTSDPKIHMTSAMPTAFKTRNVGTTLEVDPVLLAGGKLIDLNLAPEIVTQLENHYFTRKGFENTANGQEHVFMPNFYTIKDTTQISIAPGKYNLLGFHTPPKEPGKRILILVRVDLIAIE